MITADTLSDLYRHMEWADATVWTAVLRSSSACTDEKLQGLLYHLHLVQHAFLRIWRSEPRETPYPNFDDAVPLMRWAHDYYPQVMAELRSCTNQRISDVLPVPWAKMVEAQLGRPPGATTFGETALQVTMHSLYHRGQVNLRLRELGGEPPLVDYIAWLWLGRPEATWPVETRE
jgi:uncharacterized damage-inducible protein DinB